MGFRGIEEVRTELKACCLPVRVWIGRMSKDYGFGALPESACRCNTALIFPHGELHNGASPSRLDAGARGRLTWPQMPIGRPHHAYHRRPRSYRDPKGQPSEWTGAKFPFTRHHPRFSSCRGFLHEEGRVCGILLLARNPRLPLSGRARPRPGRVLEARL
jgi:hypothetical protein